MTARLDPDKAAPGAFKPMFALENSIKSSGLETTLLHLVKLRASQINGCAYCVHLHTREARADGEAEARLYLLSAWRESSLYTPRERAAFAWTDALTLLAETSAPDDVYAEVAAQFSEEEIVKLTLAIGTINTWNRIAVGFRMEHPEAWTTAT